MFGLWPVNHERDSVLNTKINNFQGRLCGSTRYTKIVFSNDKTNNDQNSAIAQCNPFSLQKITIEAVRKEGFEAVAQM